MTLGELLKEFNKDIKLSVEVERMQPLFTSKEEYEQFQKEHNQYAVKRGDISTYKGNCYLGVDAGSTTTKVALVGEDGELLYSFYSSNNGSPLKTTIQAIHEISEILPKDVKIAASCSNRLWGSTHQSCSAARFRRSRNNRPLLCGILLRSKSRLYPRYRGPGYEMHQDQEQCR